MSLVIRQEQLEDLRTDMVSRFEERMAVHLPQTFPEQLGSMPENELRSMIRKGISKTESYGIDLEMDVQRYLECMAMFDPEFDEKPEFEWAGKILNDSELTGTQKMDSIDSHMIFAQEVQ